MSWQVHRYIYNREFNLLRMPEMPKLSITIHLKAPEDWNLNIFQRCGWWKLSLQNQNVACEVIGPGLNLI